MKFKHITKRTHRDRQRGRGKQQCFKIDNGECNPTIKSSSTRETKVRGRKVNWKRTKHLNILTVEAKWLLSQTMSLYGYLYEFGLYICYTAFRHITSSNNGQELSTHLKTDFSTMIHAAWRKSSTNPNTQFNWIFGERKRVNGNIK